MDSSKPNILEKYVGKQILIDIGEERTALFAFVTGCDHSHLELGICYNVTARNGWNCGWKVLFELDKTHKITTEGQPQTGPHDINRSMCRGIYFYDILDKPTDETADHIREEVRQAIDAFNAAS